jgi:hypothetical protein
VEEPKKSELERWASARGKARVAMGCALEGSREIRVVLGKRKVCNLLRTT